MFWGVCVLERVCFGAFVFWSVCVLERVCACVDEGRGQREEEDLSRERREGKMKETESGID